jgi:hypothetical protein
LTSFGIDGSGSDVLGGIWVASIRVTEVRSGNSVVRDSDRGKDALDNGSDGGVCVSLNSGVSKVSSKTVGLDDGAVMGRGANQSGGWEDESIGGSQANQEDGDLIMRRK